MPADAVPQSEDRDAPNWDPFCNLQYTLPEEVLEQAAKRSLKEVKAAVEDAADREVKADYALRLSILNRLMRLRPGNLVRSLVEESPSFRSGLLTLRLATHSALSALAGRGQGLPRHIRSGH